MVKTSFKTTHTGTTGIIILLKYSSLSEHYPPYFFSFNYLTLEL